MHFEWCLQKDNQKEDDYKELINQAPINVGATKEVIKMNKPCEYCKNTSELIDSQEAEIEELKHTIKFLLSFAPKPPLKGLNPTFYHTLDYEGDLNLSFKIEAIKAKQ